MPAVTQLARGWQFQAGGVNSPPPPGWPCSPRWPRSRPSCQPWSSAPSEWVPARPIAGRANVTRVLLGSVSAQRNDSADQAVVLEANIDDLDPRLWPGILARLLTAGALDAWLVPILMKKGRPAHTLCALARPDAVAALRDIILSETSSLGVRHHVVSRLALPRAWIDVEIGSGTVPVKIGYRSDRSGDPEFDAVAAYAAEHGEPEHSIVQRTLLAAATLGIKQGAPVPSLVR